MIGLYIGGLLAVLGAIALEVWTVHRRKPEVDPAAWEAGVQAGREKLRHRRPSSWLTVLRRKPEFLGSDRPGRHSEKHFALINDETRYFTDNEARRLNDLLTDWERGQKP